MITQERLKELLHYDPLTGDFTWIKKLGRKIKIGNVAGSIKPEGYVKIKIDSVLYFSHRLAWLYVHGKFPENGIDHMNGIKTDNRLSNLREASSGDNAENKRKAQLNNKSGLLGVSLDKGKYRAQIQIKGKLKRIGYFDTPESAHAAYLEEKRKVHAFNTL